MTLMRLLLKPYSTKMYSNMDIKYMKNNGIKVFILCLIRIELSNCNIFDFMDRKKLVILSILGQLLRQNTHQKSPKKYL